MTTNSQHTPGPWAVEGSQIWSKDGACITDRIFNGEANAKLIAASPDLLEVARYTLADMEGLLSELGNDPDPTEFPAWKTIVDLREAIAKATT